MLAVWIQYLLVSIKCFVFFFLSLSFLPLANSTQNPPEPVPSDISPEGLHCCFMLY